MRAFVGVTMVMLAAALAACGLQVKDLEPGETGTVERVFDGDTIALQGGLRVQLTGVTAPDVNAPYGPQSRTALDALAAGREARLFYGGERRLGEDLALAQVYVRTESGGWIWLQERMALDGHARARSFKGNAARADKILKAEAKARAARRGLWADPAYAVRNAQTVSGAEGGFQIVEGEVRSIEARDDRVYLNFGDDYREDFTIMILTEDLAAWGATPLEPQSLEGVDIRVRGPVRDRGGALIQVDHPEQLEILAK